MLTSKRLLPLFAPKSHLYRCFSRFESSIFVDPEDIGKKPSYKGSLMVVPTPIGNLGDLSLRQYEALTTCDIIACEDTRKTGKMIEMLIEKKMKERFRNSFGTSFDSFMDSARDSVVDE